VWISEWFPIEEHHHHHEEHHDSHGHDGYKKK